MAVVVGAVILVMSGTYCMINVDPCKGLYRKKNYLGFRALGT